jgi:uncharacterized protein with GYD domain
MRNPWLDIPEVDYVGHMSSPTVKRPYAEQPAHRIAGVWKSVRGAAIREGARPPLALGRSAQVGYRDRFSGGGDMPKYLLEVAYTAQGTKGVMKDGGSKRRGAARSAIKSLGGKMEAFYFAFGDQDAIVIADLPDAVSAAAMSLNVAATGAASAKVRVLLTAEDIDKATKKTAVYTPPGG